MFIFLFLILYIFIFSTSKKIMLNEKYFIKSLKRKNSLYIYNHKLCELFKEMRRNISCLRQEGTCVQEGCKWYTKFYQEINACDASSEITHHISGESHDCEHLRLSDFRNDCLIAWVWIIKKRVNFFLYERRY